MPDQSEEWRSGYRAACERGVLFDMTGRTHVELTGRDRAKFLHNFCTNDIRNLAPGRACEAFLTSVQGKILAFVSVYAHPESLWLTSVPGSAVKIINHLSRYHISEEVSFVDRTAELATLLVAGPTAPALVESVLPGALRLEPMQVSEALFNQSAIHIRRHDFLRLPCLILVAPSNVEAPLRERLTAAGALAAGNDLLESLRIEAGFPLYGVDLSDVNLAQEASRTRQAISFTKGCYLGQEPIARIDAMGHVNQQLRGVRLSTGAVPPPPQSEIYSPGPDPKKVGQVTSSAISGADGHPIALAFLRRGFETPGTQVELRLEGTHIPAEVFWPEETPI
ncbi:MAG: YgfZ/GcvT domain-containing protein [Planctomycetales bacterium]